MGYERYAMEVELSNFLEVKEFKASRNLGTTTQTATGMSGPWGARWCTTEKKEDQGMKRKRDDENKEGDCNKNLILLMKRVKILEWKLLKESWRL